MLSPPVLILEELDALSVARHCLRSYIHTRLCATCTPLSSQLSIQYSVRRSEYRFHPRPRAVVEACHFPVRLLPFSFILRHVAVFVSAVTNGTVRTS